MVAWNDGCSTRRFATCILLTSSVISVVLIYLMDRTPSTIYMHNNLNITDVANHSRAIPTYIGSGQSNNTKIIMFWSTWYGQKNWFKFKEDRMGAAPFRSKECPDRNCFLISDRSRVKEADALLFYFSDHFTWPAKRYPHQYYAHLVHEASGNRKPGSKTFLERYSGHINVTMNYRHDADVFVPYTEFIPIHINTTEYKSRIPLADKTKMAVWPVSNCAAPSKRQEYVRELQKHIPVDIFGACGPHKCSRGRGDSCLKQWEKTYKFYISFENNICDDYITEKMSQPLSHELIPVVLGGGNYTRDAPHHSVINARDFSSPKHLAEFLIKLAGDEARYQSYFAWKPHYTSLGGVTQTFCK